ncbi:MAG: hypothetical protein ABIJ45_12255 [Candidatus Zixiibacteriota bacterium]
MLDKLKDDSGLTLIELFVALLLVSLLMIFVVSGNLFVNKFISEWQDDNRLYEEGRFILKTIANDIKTSSEFYRIDSSEFRLISDINDTVSYLNRENRLLRNGMNLMRSDVFCNSVALDINNFEKQTPDSILVNGKVIYEEKMVRITIKLQYKKVEETFETDVRLRNENNIF